MIGEKVLESSRIRERQPLIGTLGYLAVFAWSLGMIMFSAEDRIVVSAAACLMMALLLYPAAFRRLLRLRWLFLLGTLVLVSGLWMDAADMRILSIPFSLTGLQAGLRMALRAVVIMIAVDGFSSSVDIAEVAGLLERLGLPGLGFSLGVAVNLLPSLRHSSATTWRSLRMRGGFRHQRWRAVQLFMVTVMANALRRGEEIAMAAEARAYSPDRTRALPLKTGRLDGWILAAGLVVTSFFLFIL